MKDEVRLGSGEERARAVALRYAQGSAGAPKVVAKGAGDVAERILAVARENGVPVREDADLVALLGACELGDEIPVEMFTAIAELLVHLYQLNESLRPAAG
ncbi:EscU/YscU/HrcU family type III secretion system export apparatus switch protein [Engelhardtia mirabilis]|uniref:Flagellar biosynthetic protein FlhB n=1 Tax=Engelhardtia mirabilis TaxID=2528011 RepID=A0A518BQH1_9BACT|nr:Flagellar biosynthetic protein FlhB [Planctomycetes bacterium Pla133]QDV03536.1 Flagellar biosynthetic protein FlhB [Planctomycetes bacterium Pla86]